MRMIAQRPRRTRRSTEASPGQGFRPGGAPPGVSLALVCAPGRDAVTGRTSSSALVERGIQGDEMNRRNVWTVATAAAILMAGAACMGAGAGATKVELKTDDDKTLYALGLTIGGNIMPYGLSAAELEIVKKGFGDGALGAKPDIEADAFRQKLPAFMQAHMAAKAQGQKEKSKAFLAQAEKETGAQKTASGMIFTETAKAT